MLRRFKALFSPRRLRPAKDVKAQGLPDDTQPAAGGGQSSPEGQIASAMGGDVGSESSSSTIPIDAARMEAHEREGPASAEGRGNPEKSAKAQTPAQRIGSAGEAAAEKYLIDKGYRLLERNWRAGRDEIDLIALDGQALVFVEVRTRAQNALVGGFHSIDARKKAALRRVCGAYLKTRNPRPRTYRLDVVQISMGKGGQMTINHYAGRALFN